MREIKNLIGENLRKLRGGRSLAELHRATGIQDHYLSRIEKGKANITVAILEKLAAYFDVPVVRLFGYELNPRPVIEHKLVVSHKAVYGENIENFIPVPLLADPASLGPGLKINEEMVDGTCLIHRRVLKKTGEYQAIFVKGDSMVPTLQDGDIVAIDVNDRNPEKLKSKLVACHGGDFQVSIKQLLFVNDRFYFRAVNRKWEEEYAPMITPKKDELILGKVVWAWKKFD